MSDRTYYDLDPETRRRAEKCADQIAVIRALEDHGHNVEALELTELTLEVSRQLHRRALVPWGAMTEGIVAGIIIPGNIAEKFYNAALGASMGWLVGHSRHIQAVGDLEYLVDALDEHSHRLRALLAADAVEAAAKARKAAKKPAKKAVKKTTSEKTTPAPADDAEG